MTVANQKSNGGIKANGVAKSLSILSIEASILAQSGSKRAVAVWKVTA